MTIKKWPSQRVSRKQFDGIMYNVSPTLSSMSQHLLTGHNLFILWELLTWSQRGQMMPSNPDSGEYETSLAIGCLHFKIILTKWAREETENQNESCGQK
jgi:hypothetical protein